MTTFGCVSTIKVGRQEPVITGTFVQATFNGDYLNKSTASTLAGYTLWDRLYASKSYRIPKFPIPDHAVINIRYDQSGTLAVKAFVDERAVDSMILKVKRAGAYISIKRRLRLIPIPILYYIHDEQKALAANNDAGDLILKTGSSVYLWAFLFAVGGRDDYNSFTFSRINK